MTSHLTRLVFVLSGFVAALLIAGCKPGDEKNSDPAVELALLLDKATKQIREGNQTEVIVPFEPATGPYTLAFTPSWGESGRPSEDWHSTLVLSGRSYGAVNDHHNRYVRVPRALSIKKTGGPVQIVLRRVDGDISIVELR